MVILNVKNIFGLVLRQIHAGVSYLYWRYFYVSAGFVLLPVGWRLAVWIVLAHPLGRPARGGRRAVFVATFRNRLPAPLRSGVGMNGGHDGNDDLIYFMRWSDLETVVGAGASAPLQQF